MKKIRSLLLAAGFLSAATVTLFIGCQASHDHSSHSHASAAAKAYPLKTCIVTNEKLGGHGDAYAFVHQGQEIKLCCEGCREDFDKEPAKYLQKLAQAK